MSSLKSGSILVLSALATMAGQSAFATMPPLPVIAVCTQVPAARKAHPAPMNGSIDGPHNVTEGDGFAFTAIGTDQDVVPCITPFNTILREDPVYPGEHAPVVTENTAQVSYTIDFKGHNGTGTGTWEIYGIAIPVDADRVKVCRLRFVDNAVIPTAIDAPTFEFTKSVNIKNKPTPPPSP